MREFLNYIYNMKFDSASIGIQKDLLLAALIGVVSNLPKEVKSNLHQAIHIIVGTLLSTIMTPMIISLIEMMSGKIMPPSSGYGIAALVGILGINTIKKIILSKLTSKDNNGDSNS